MSVIHSHIEVLGGIPLPAIRNQTLSILLDPLLKYGLRVSEGPHVTEETGLGPLNDAMVTHPNFSGRGRMKFETRISWGYRQYPGIPGTGSLSTFIKAGPVKPDALLDAVVGTVKLLGAPMGYLDLLDGQAYRERRDHHRQVYQAACGEKGDRRFGTHRGFSGVPWRMVLGPDLVAHFGADALGALPKRLARRINDEVWVLTPCDSPEDWSSVAWCAGETEIIEALGADSFFDPATEALPTREPDIPNASPLPIKFITKEAASVLGPFEYFNGYVEP